jgi:hypothetical protein
MTSKVRRGLAPKDQPSQNQAAAKLPDGSTIAVIRYRDRVSRAEAVIDIEGWRFRALMECWQHATAETWERRAALLEWARPKPTDFVGRSTVQERAERDAELAAAAKACRNHAALLRGEV